MEKQQTNATRESSYKGAGMAIGLTLGGIIGMALGNIVLAGGCMVLGLAIGSLMDRQKAESKS